MRKSYYFVGFDQGLANSGVAVIKITTNKRKVTKKEVLYHEHIKTSSKDSSPIRIRKIFNKLSSIFNEYDIDGCACEHLYKTNTIHSSRNYSAGIMDANLTSTLLILIAGQKEIYFKSFVPSSIKKFITGSGKATKEDMINSALKIYKINGPIVEHIADAICIGTAVGINYLKDKQLIDEV